MDELLAKALPVEGGEVDDAEPKWDLPAQSAASYLKMVRQEASKCPDVVIAANIENVKMNSLQTYFVPAEASLKAPAGLEPSIQWQIKQILEFAKLRDKLSKMKETYAKSKKDSPRFPPDLTDGQRWVIWCCGKQVLQNHSGAVNGEEDDGDEDEDDDEDGESNRSSAERSSAERSSAERSSAERVRPDCVSAILGQLKDKDDSPDYAAASSAAAAADAKAAEKLELKEGNPPLVSVAMHLTQVMVETLLKHHFTYMNDRGFHVQQGPWIYALLALLQKPLTPDTCATLRDLARLCARLRSGLDSPTHPHLAPLNLFISLVARYFDQRDMADGANVSL